MRRLADLWGECPEEMRPLNRAVATALWVVGLLLLAMVPGKG